MIIFMAGRKETGEKIRPTSIERSGKYGRVEGNCEKTLRVNRERTMRLEFIVNYTKR